MTLRRLQGFVGHVRSPRAVVLALRMIAWSLLLPLLKRFLPLPTLVRLVACRARSSRRAARESLIATFAWGIYRARPSQARDNCLERSLLAYRFLSRGSADPRLVIGVRKPEDEMLGHAWVVVDGVPLYDSPSAISEYTVLAEFAANGALVGGSDHLEHHSIRARGSVF